MANVLKLMTNIFRKCTIPRHTGRNLVSAQYSSVTKDLARTLQKEQTIAVHSQDILLGSLKTAATTSNVLDIVKSHAVVMNNKHLMQALRSLFTLQKGGQSKLSTQQILKHPDFELLCKTLRKHSGSIELNETIEALKVVNYVGVASDSTIVQVLMQLLRHQVNYLSLQQIIFLDFLFSQMKSTPPIEAMQMALPLIFEIQLSTKLDRENVAMLADCLHYSGKRNVSEKCVEFLVNTIAKHTDPMDTKTAMSILWSLCDFKADAFFEPLVTRLLEELIVDVDALNYGDMETTLAKLTKQYSSKHPFYYSDVFCDLVCNYAMDRDLGTQAAIFILKKLHRVDHTNDKLLNYVSEKFVEDPNLFHSLDPMSAFNYINTLALSDYRPKYWNQIRTMIGNTPMFKNLEKRDIIWLRLAANLSILNIFKIDVFEMAFRENYLRKIFKTNYPSDFESLIILNQSVMTYKPELQNIMPNEQTIQAAASKIRLTTEFPLESVLLNVFGGEKYIKTGVRTKLHHHIDHLILLRKGGFPVAFASDTFPSHLEDINLTEDLQVLAVIALASHHFTANSKRLKGRVASALRTLEMKGCIVVPINVTDWSHLPDFERIPFIMRLIKSKTSENDLVFKEVL